MKKYNGLNALIWTMVTLAYALLSGHCAAQSASDNEADASPTAESFHRVTFKAPDEFLLSALYYAGNPDVKIERAAAVLLIHDCSHNSEQYQPLMDLLVEKGVHALALDLRGFGKSTSPVFSHQDIKLKAKDVVTYQGEMAKLNVFWQGDILAGFNFLREKAGDTARIGVLTAGCTARYAIGLAEEIRVSSFVMITPELSYADKEDYKNLFDIPALFVSSVHHANTHQTAKELYDWNGDKRSSIQLFKGDRYGYRLIVNQPFLNQNIAGWLSHVLR